MKLTPDRENLRIRNILFVLFALPGLSFASWVARTPLVRDLLEVSTSEMGIIIFSLAAGSLLGLLSAGTVIAQKGARVVILISFFMIVIGLVAIGIGATLTVTNVVMGGLIIFGCGFGAAEVALNMEGSAVEKSLNKILLPAFHGFFSVGTLIGAAIGVGAVAIHLPIIIHFSILSLLVAVGIACCYRHLPKDTGKELHSNTTRKGSAIQQQLQVWTEKRTLFIGIMVLGMAFAEGSANDWLPLIMVDGYGVIISATLTKWARPI